jgi:hypothetical protein
VEKITALNCEEQGGWLNSRSAKITLFAAVIDHTGQPWRPNETIHSASRRC